jgi:hypothetical protein
MKKWIKKKEAEQVDTVKRQNQGNLYIIVNNICSIYVD